MSLACEVRAERGGFRIDVAFESDARIVGVQGASGVGKTTLLHSLAGLVPVKTARVVVDDRVLVDTRRSLTPPVHARRIGYVFQDARLFPHMSVADNIAYATRFAPDRMDMSAVIERLGIGHLLDRWTRNLSGGETRRVAIARALAADPRLLLLDEPFAGLDADRRDDLISWLVGLMRDIRIAVLVVSHEVSDLQALGADRIVMTGGRIGRPDIAGRGSLPPAPGQALPDVTPP